MTNYLIFLMLTNAVSLDKLAVETAVKTQIKDPQTVNWAAQPQETQGGLVYYRLVVSQPHIERNLSVKPTDIAADKFTPVSSKGLVVLYGIDWRLTLDKAGYSEVKQEDPKVEDVKEVTK